MKQTMKAGVILAAGIALGVAADGAGIGRIEIAADAAGPNPPRRLRHGRGQRLHQALAPLQQEQRRPPRRSRPQPRQLGEELDEVGEVSHRELSVVSYQFSVLSLSVGSN